MTPIHPWSTGAPCASSSTLNGTTTGIRMKASRIAGGLVQNCTYSNITMYNVQYPININSYYLDGTIPSSTETTDPAQATTSTTPTPIIKA